MTFYDVPTNPHPVLLQVCREGPEGRLCALLPGWGDGDAVNQSQFGKGTHTEESPFSGNTSYQSPCGKAVGLFAANIPKHHTDLIL